MYIAITVMMSVPRWLKSMPSPGTKSIAEAISAKRSWPSACMPAMACSAEILEGRLREMTPAKMTSMALPMIFGATTAKKIQTMFIAATAHRLRLKGASREKRRLVEGQKFLAWRGAEPPIGSKPASVDSAVEVVFSAISFRLLQHRRFLGNQRFLGRPRSGQGAPRACRGQQCGRHPAPESGRHRGLTPRAGRR